MEEFLLTYIPKRTGRALSKAAMAVAFAAVKSYLKFRLGDTLASYQPFFTIASDDIKQAMENTNATTTITLDEVRKTCSRSQEQARQSDASIARNRQ